MKTLDELLEEDNFLIVVYETEDLETFKEFLKEYQFNVIRKYKVKDHYLYVRSQSFNDKGDRKAFSHSLKSKEDLSLEDLGLDPNKKITRSMLFKTKNLEGDSCSDLHDYSKFRIKTMSLKAFYGKYLKGEFD